MKISIIGAGAFGTAMAITAARAGNEVVLWAHDPDGRAGDPRDGRESGLPRRRRARRESAADERPRRSGGVLRHASSWSRRATTTATCSTRIRGYAKRPLNVISGTKGIENDTLMRMSEITEDVLGEQLQAFAVLSGPTFALEVARGDPTAAVVASKDVDVRAGDAARALVPDVPALSLRGRRRASSSPAR